MRAYLCVRASKDRSYLIRMSTPSSQGTDTGVSAQQFQRSDTGSSVQRFQRTLN